MAKHKSNTESDELPGGATATAVALRTVDLSTLLGEWICCDKLYGGIIKIVLTEGDKGDLIVHAYGRCHPTPCDWGEVKGVAYSATPAGGPADGFHANYDFGFKETLVFGTIDRRVLILHDSSVFKDGSGRANYTEYSYFGKK